MVNTGHMGVCVCVCVHVCARARACDCVCVCVWLQEDEDALLNKVLEKNKEDNVDVEVCEPFPIPAYCSR